MKYEDYIQKYKREIEEEKAMLKNIYEFITSQEYKENLEIIKKRDEVIHKNIISEIEFIQNKILKASISS